MRADRGGAFLFLLCAFSIQTVKGAPPAHLPIYLEDSHAGSFYWFATNLPLDEETTLILFDAHSDASQVFDSDRIRAALRESGDLDDTLKRWRETGAIQCFNWIEPLMPRPFARVIWVPPGNFDRSALHSEVEREINAHQLTVPRSGEILAPRFEVMSEVELADEEFAQPVVVSLDLDYFAGSSDDALESEFRRTWNAIFRLPDLRAITGAISTPYLESPDQADRLVSLFLENALEVANTKIQWEPFATIGPDRSRRAKDFLRSGQNIPAFALNTASSGLRSLVSANRERIQVSEGTGDWENLTTGWQSPRIQIIGRREDQDGCVRVRKDSGFEVRLASHTDENLPVRWEVLSSEHPVYNLLGDGTRFANDASRWIRWKRTSLPAKRPWVDDKDLSPFLDPETGCGTIRIRAKTGQHHSNILILRISRSEGFLGAVEESFQLPYILGGSRLSEGGLTGSDLALGGDCANLAVYALRRTERYLRWMTPVELRPHTEEIRSFLPEDIERGIFADFGSHLAVLIEDLPPKGRVSENDRFAHHLEGFPEIVTFGALSKSRRPARICRLSSPDDTISLVFAGDTMLSRTIGEAIRIKKANPFRNIQEILQSADIAIVNLECSLTEKQPTPISGKTFQFPAPPTSAGLLASAGVDLVSLANNHSADASLPESISLLGAAGVTPFGHPEAPCTELICQGVRIGLAGWQPGDSLESVHELVSQNDFTIVFAHWGTEYEAEVDETQVESARKMAVAGVDLIVGSGPHRVQKSDMIGRTPVYYSLGNFVFDGDGPNPEWKEGRLLHVELDSKGRIMTRTTLPVSLGPEGFPAHPSATK